MVYSFNSIENHSNHLIQIMPMSRNNKKKDKNKKKRHPNHKAGKISASGGKKTFENVKKQAIVHELGEKTPHKDNLPEIIMAFIKDELEARTEQDEQREIINAGIACWNIGSFGERGDMEQKLMETAKKVKADEKLEQAMKRLLERRVTNYGKYKYFITDYEIERTVLGTWDLSVSSFDFSRLAAMKEMSSGRS